MLTNTWIREPIGWKYTKNPVNIRIFRRVLLQIFSPKSESICKEYTAKNIVSSSFSTLAHPIGSRIQVIVYIWNIKIKKQPAEFQFLHCCFFMHNFFIGTNQDSVQYCALSAQRRGIRTTRQCPCAETVLSVLCLHRVRRIFLSMRHAGAHSLHWFQLAAKQPHDVYWQMAQYLDSVCHRQLYIG